MRHTKLYGVARNNKTEIKRFGKFAVVGLSGLVVDYLVLNVLTYFFKVDEALAIAIAFICAAGNNFVWNRLWVYPESRSEKKRRQMPIFLGVNAVGLLINELIFFGFNKSIDALLAAAPIALLATHHQGIGLNLTKAIAAIVVMFWNYFINRRVTFRNVAWQRRDGQLHDADDQDGGVNSAL